MCVKFQLLTITLLWCIHETGAETERETRTRPTGDNRFRFLYWFRNYLQGFIQPICSRFLSQSRFRPVSIRLHHFVTYITQQFPGFFLFVGQFFIRSLRKIQSVTRFRDGSVFAWESAALTTACSTAQWITRVSSTITNLQTFHCYISLNLYKLALLLCKSYIFKTTIGHTINSRLFPWEKFYWEHLSKLCAFVGHITMQIF